MNHIFKYIDYFYTMMNIYHVVIKTIYFQMRTNLFYGNYQANHEFFENFDLDISIKIQKNSFCVTKI